MTGKIILLMGFPASGKSAYAKKFVDAGYIRVSRDELGGSLDALIPKLSEIYAETNASKLILDATYSTIKSRAAVIKWAREHDFIIDCRWLATNIGDCFFNASHRMIEKYGKLLMPEDIKISKDPNIFPPVVIFKYKKSFEQPSMFEGFASVKKIRFERKIDRKIYKNKAIILDYDGTIRKTKSGEKWPTDPEDIEILPNRKEVIKQYQAFGYFILGVSNQSGIGKGSFTTELAIKCFEKTNLLLGVDIDYKFCPHSTFPINCYCRKPMPGLGVEFIEKYKLNPSDCIMVGDMKTDATFADRCGFNFIESDDFFA